MARKYDLISELYSRTCKTVVMYPQNWEAFCVPLAGITSCVLTSSCLFTHKDRTQRRCLKSRGGMGSFRKMGKSWRQ